MLYIKARGIAYRVCRQGFAMPVSEQGNTVAIEKVSRTPFQDFTRKSFHHRQPAF